MQYNDKETKKFLQFLINLWNTQIQPLKSRKERDLLLDVEKLKKELQQSADTIIKRLGSHVTKLEGLLREADDRRLVLVAGGGAPARVYQTAYTETARRLGYEAGGTAADWIGIMATRLNAQLLKAACGALCMDDVIYNPTEKIAFTGKALVAAGWKPGFSTDNDAVLLAEQFSADTVLNLSNIEQVYTDDPRKNPDAKPIDHISWADFRKMVGDEWTPGKNTPFDGLVSAHATIISAESAMRPSAIDIPAIVRRFSVNPKSCKSPTVHTLSAINSSKIRTAAEKDS